MKSSEKFILSFCLFLVLGSYSNAFSQYYFGRNKIQYDDFEWKILKTEHFDVYFYPEMTELAEIGAAFAEKAYHRLEAKLNHNIKGRIPLIFYSNHSHFQQTNTIPSFIPEGVGGFFEFIKGRVVIPSDGSIHKFKHVINHELVHVFTRSKMNRVLKDHRKTTLAGLPLWFTEGIAEYWSEGWDSQADMILRDAVLSGHLVPLSKMDYIYGTFLMYKEGQAICKYIAENFGEEKLLQLIENIWKENYFSDVMKLTIGLNYKEFDEKWIYDLKKKNYPLLEEGDSPKMVTKVVTREGINTKPTCFKQDGQEWAVFVSNRVGYSNIYKKPLKSQNGQTEVVVKGERTSDFESFHLLSSKISVNQKGQLAFVSKSGASDVIHVFDIANKTKIKKFKFEGLVSLSSPNWSPVGDKIVFSGISFAGLSDLYVVEAATGKLQRLTNDFYDDRDPAWAPDGKAIAFSSDRSYYGKHGFMNLFLYNLENGSIQYLTVGKQNDYSPAWSPDGKKIAFASDREGAFNIWMIKNNLQEPEILPISESFKAALVQETHPQNVIWGDGKNGSNGSSLFNWDEPEYDFPSAIETADQIKKITNFTTGAFDPVWLNEDRMLFTAFENFSFQIREIDNLTEKFEEAPATENDSLMVKRNNWTADKLAGEIESQTLKYKRKFNLDIAQSAISQDPIIGVSGGAQIAMSDMLGNQQYYFLIYNNAQTRGEFFKSWNVAITRVELSKRINYAIGGYHITGRFFDQVDSFFDQRRLGGFVAASYPFSVFSRLEGSINLRKESRVYDTRGQTVDGIVVSNAVSYVKDNSLWGFTGPIDGERFKFTLGHTVDVQHNDVNFYTIILDYRKYFRLGRRVTYATRLMTRINQGKEAFRYFMGGSWDLRLHPRWRIWGRKLFLINNELRFPFIDRFLLGFPFGGLGFNAIRGATFLDFGQAWDRDYQFNEILGSLGFGLRLRIGGFLVLRYEIGRKFKIRDFNSPSLHFEKGLKKAFWFGFDF
ncbi:MAG: peptidase MA family metallohydrolase [bacterium]